VGLQALNRETSGQILPVLSEQPTAVLPRNHNSTILQAFMLFNVFASCPTTYA